MTNDRQLSISRRKVLAGLGTIGIASAGAGLGTTAYFSDQETFQNNQLTAGTLDMLVDWEEHYYNGTAGRSLVEVVEADPDVADLILPAKVEYPDARPIALRYVGDGTVAELQDEFWDATSIEALPDADDDGIQDEFDDELVCEEDILVNVGGNSTGLSSDKRTASSVEEPLIMLDDVKPGDFGEVTFSFHLCSNPGYVWMNGANFVADENGITEPEGNDPHEQAGVVELLDEMLVRMWYDPDGDNQLDVLRGDTDIMIAVDTSGSIDSDEMADLKTGVAEFVANLPTDGSVQAGMLTFGDNAVTVIDPLGTPSDIDASDLPNDGEGNTPLPAALDIADQHLADPSFGRPDALKTIVLFSDGGPNYGNEQYSAAGYTAPRGSPDDPGYSLDDSNDQYDGADGGSGVVSATEQEETAGVAEQVRDNDTRIFVINVADAPDQALGAGGTPLSDYLENDIASPSFYEEVAPGVLVDVAESLVAEILVPEEVFFQGTLREAQAYLTDNDGRGIPLDGDTATPFDELADPENDPDRDCFAGEGTTHYVGFQWWLPIDHANQVQSDTVSFDIGFYTEQCRHNDGAGMIPEQAAESEPEEVEQVA